MVKDVKTVINHIWRMADNCRVW